MRVIGTSNDHVILEATKREVGQLCGYYSQFNDLCRDLKHGQIINVHGMYAQLYELARLEAKRKAAHNALTDMLKALEDVPAFNVQASSEGEPYVAS